MTARAEGFWWVNVGGSGFVAQAFMGFLHCPGTAVLYKLDEEFIRWGPYLGKEPQDFLAAIVAYASDHGADRVGGLSFEEIVRELATAGADTLRIVVDEGRRPVRTVTVVSDVNLEDIDPLHWDQRDLDGAQAILEAEQERLAEETPTP